MTPSIHTKCKYCDEFAGYRNEAHGLIYTCKMCEFPICPDHSVCYDKFADFGFEKTYFCAGNPNSCSREKIWAKYTMARRYQISLLFRDEKNNFINVFLDPTRSENDGLHYDADLIVIYIEEDSAAHRAGIKPTGSCSKSGAAQSTTWIEHRAN